MDSDNYKTHPRRRVACPPCCPPHLPLRGVESPHGGRTKRLLFYTAAIQATRRAKVRTAGKVLQKQKKPRKRHKNSLKQRASAHKRTHAKTITANEGKSAPFAARCNNIAATANERTQTALESKNGKHTRPSSV